MTADAAIDAALRQLDARLHVLGEALRVQSADTVAREAAALQRALVALRRSLHGDGRARSQPVPASLALRLAAARTAGQIAAQREAVARRSAAVARALDLLLPPTVPRVAYSVNGR